MKKVLLIGIALAAAYLGGVQSGFIPPVRDPGSNSVSSDDQVFATAFKNHRSNIQVQGSGQVVRVLPDDNDGSRHQRFIVRLASGQTLLVAHNIDLANRVAALKSGDSIEFKGEYAWSAQGGVIHWTHRDPGRNHVDGWIKHDGHQYQ